VREPDLFDFHDAASQNEGAGTCGAEIVAFPLSRDIGRARKMAAAILKRRSPAAQQAQFERDALAVGRRLRAAGIDEAETARQIAALTRAVNAELARQQHGRAQA
jgi:hypothetical protein